MKKSHFWGDWWFLCDLSCHFWWIFGWDWGTPAILRQYPNIYGHLQGKLGFGQFWKKKLGLGQIPPSLGQIPNLYRKLVFQAPLIWKGGLWCSWWWKQGRAGESPIIPVSYYIQCVFTIQHRFYFFIGVKMFLVWEQLPINQKSETHENKNHSPWKSFSFNRPQREFKCYQLCHWE